MVVIQRTFNIRNQLRCGYKFIVQNPGSNGRMLSDHIQASFKHKHCKGYLLQTGGRLCDYWLKTFSPDALYKHVNLHIKNHGDHTLLELNAKQMRDTLRRFRDWVKIMASAMSQKQSDVFFDITLASEWMGLSQEGRRIISRAGFGMKKSSYNNHRNALTVKQRRNVSELRKTKTHIAKFDNYNHNYAIQRFRSLSAASVAACNWSTHAITVCCEDIPLTRTQHLPVDLNEDIAEDGYITGVNFSGILSSNNVEDVLDLLNAARGDIMSTAFDDFKCVTTRSQSCPVKHHPDTDVEEKTSLDDYTPVALLDENPGANAGLDAILMRYVEWYQHCLPQDPASDGGEFFMAGMDCNIYYRVCKVRYLFMYIRAPYSVNDHMCCMDHISDCTISRFIARTAGDFCTITCALFWSLGIHTSKPACWFSRTRAFVRRYGHLCSTTWHLTTGSTKEPSLRKYVFS